MDYISLGCCSLAFILYLNTLNSGFVYDDRRAILGNSDVSGSNAWHNAFHNDYWGTPLTDSGSHGSYRPLCVLTFRLNFILGGYTPWGFHLINNLMHCLATGLVVRLARQFFSSTWGIVTTGTLFAAHPIHTEAVAGIVGRADLASCIFYLLTFLAYMRHIMWRECNDSRQWFSLILTIILASVGLLFKETAITALIVCALFDIIRGFGGFIDKQRRRSIVIIMLIICFTLYCRLLILPRPQFAFSTADNPIAKNKSLWTRFLTFTYLPVFNFNLLLNPHILSFDWGMDAIPRVNSIRDRRNLLSILFYTILVLVLWRNFKTLYKIHFSGAHNKSQNAESQCPEILNARSARKSRTKKKQTAMRRTSSIYTINTVDPSSLSSQLSYCSVTNNNQISIIKQGRKFFTSQFTTCKECKNEFINHTSSCRVLNNNNNVLLGDINSPTFLNCCCRQALASKNELCKAENHKAPQHRLAAAFHRAIATVKPRSSRSSSSCSNSTTASSKSSESTLSTYSTSSSICSSFYGSSINLQSITGFQLINNMTQSAKNSSILLMAIAFLTLPFLPASNLFFYVGFVVAERLLYLPSVGFCLLIGFGISKMLDNSNEKSSISYRKIAIILFLCLVVGTMSARTINRNYDWRDEESLYRSAIPVNPPKALGNLGSVLSSQARYEEARQTLLQAIKYRPNMADVHFNLGILYQNQRNFKSAVECFQRAIQFRPNLGVAYLNLGISLIALGKLQEAAHILQEGIKVDGSGVRDRISHENARISSYLQLGSLYVDQGKYQRALDIYQEALNSITSSHHQKDVLYHRIGDVFGHLEQWEEAERHHKFALDLQPNHVAAHLSYGITLSRNISRASEAEVWFKRALKLAPKQASVYHHYAQFLTTQNRHEEAVFYHTRAAELAPNDYTMVVAAATALRLLDRKTEAANWYQKAVHLRPEDAHAHTNLGAILHLLGQTNHAAASYKQALKLQPGDPTTLSNLAKLGITKLK